MFFVFFVPRNKFIKQLDHSGPAFINYTNQQDPLPDGRD